MAELAPLIATPDAPVPPGGEAEWFTGAGGARLRAALFQPKTRARGSIILSPGRTEAIEKYYEFIGECLERGFVVLAHDWRGQGLSVHELADRLKGHARGYNAFLGDFQALLRTFEARLPKPWVAVGHSMGGCLTLLAIAHGERRFAGVMLSSPMLGVKTGKVAPNRARLAARLHVALGRANRYVQGQPGKPFDQEFDGNILTHDRARFARNCGLIAAEPQLALGAPTWGWLEFAFRATAYLARPDRLREITVPVVILSAGEDQLVDNTAQAAAARHLPQGKLITVPGASHEILMETDPMRNIFMRAFDALTGRVAPKPAEAPKRAAAAPAAPAATAPAAAPAAAAPAPKPEAKPAPAPTATPAVVAPKVEAKAAAKPAAAKAAQPAAKKPATAKTAEAKTAEAKTAAPKAAGKKPAAAKAAPAAKKPAGPKARSGGEAPAAAKKPSAKPAAAKAAPKTAAKAPAKTPAPKAAAKPAAKPAAKAQPAKAAAATAAAPKTTASKTTAPKKPAAAKAAPAKAVAKPAAKKPAAAKKAVPAA